MRAGLMGMMLLLLSACSQKEGEQPRGAADHGTLSGEVFIVTQGGPSIKLGLVNIIAIPEEELSLYIEQKNALAATLRADRQSALKALQETISHSRQARADANKEVEKATQDAYADYLKCLETADSFEVCITERKRKVQQAKQDIPAGRSKNLAMEQAELERLQSEMDYLGSSDYYFAELPAGIASAKTNADGLFTMTIPRQGRFGLAARASRLVLGKTERYYWLVWESLDGTPSKRIMLSNDNTTTVASPDSVVIVAQ